MPERPWEDEFTLLCEKCGYVIEGLDREGNCPECGKAIAESLPERRVGTAWQQRPSVGSLLCTWWATLRHPMRTLDIMSFSGSRSTSLASLSCAPTAFAWPAVMTLSLVEARGLRFFGRRRGLRVTRTIAWAICAHGAVGWLVGAVAFWIGLLATTVIWLGFVGWEQHGEGEFAYRSPTLPGWAWDALELIPFCILVIWFAGFLFFETFAWLGLRRCKFANRARPPTTIEP